MAISEFGIYRLNKGVPFLLIIRYNQEAVAFGISPLFIIFVGVNSLPIKNIAHAKF